jgi:SAM-dependent methyltransferase
MLQSNIQGWGKPYAFEKHWSVYYEKDIQSDNYLVHKEQIIEQWLEKLHPSSILDIGANTGRFSFIAKKYADKVIALEADDICVDIIEQQIKAEKASGIYAALMDLVETTPNIGALNKEFSSIFTRAKSALVMSLALVHHLHISNQLSFAQIAELFSLFCTQHLIVEFIPITDAKVQLLLRDKIMDLSEYDEVHFLASLSSWFVIKENITLQNSERRLFLLEKK